MRAIAVTAAMIMNPPAIWMPESIVPNISREKRIVVTGSTFSKAETKVVDKEPTE